MRRLVAAFVAAALAAAVALAGCSDEPSVREADLEEFRTLLDRGLTYRTDPFVRAESLRVVELLGAPALRKPARQRLEDDNAMVRTAALRALFATDAPKANARAVRLFNDGSPATKRAVVRTVLDYDTEEQQREMLWRATEPKQPAELRRYAFRQGLVPRVRRAMQEGSETFVRKLFLPNVNEYLTDLDTELGGPILELMLEFGETDRAEPLIEEFADRDNPVERRVRAAEILIDAGAESAKPAFAALLERTHTDTTEGRLALPEKRLDKRLVRAAILGIVAAGDEAHVSQAKRYMKDASPGEYIEVLEALSHNPTESARLALENALRDARPRVRHAAIDLYARRDDAKVDTLVAVHQNEVFKEQTRPTRHRIARAVGEQFDHGWVETLQNQLASEEGVEPALRLLRHVYGETGEPGPIARLKEDLVRVAESDQKSAVPVAAYLLMQLPPEKRSDEIDRLVASVDHPLPRYAYLEDQVRHSQGEKVGFLLDNLYSQEGAPELFTIRLISGAALWAGEHETSPGPNSESSDGAEAGDQPQG